MKRCERRRRGLGKTGNGLGKEGIALLMVLWTVAIIAVLGMAFSSVARVELMSTVAYGDRIRDRFAAEAGVRRAIVEIIYARSRAEDAWSLEGSPAQGSLAHAAFEARILPEESRIDVNRSSPQVLHGLLISLGLSASEADGIVDAVQDWRDPDDLVRTSGAEDAFYNGLDPPYEPRNADFETVDEIRLVRGITAELWTGTEHRKGLRDLLTVYSPTGKIDPDTAPPEILRALDGMTDASVEEIMALREDEGLPPLSALNRTRELTPAAAGVISAASGRVYRIHSRAVRDKGPVAVGVEAVVSIQGNSADILYWNSRGRFEQTAAGASGAPGDE